MLFFFRKLIEALMLPVGISGILVIAGVVFRRRWIAIIGVVMLYCFSTQFTGRQIMRSLEHVYVPKTAAEAPDADAIVVLSGGILRGRTAAGVQWGESASRYFSGIDLATAGKAKIIVFSIGLDVAQGVILRSSAIRQGIPAERIVLTPLVSTTDDEARAVSEIRGIHSILLVTSAFHMPRAALLFRARGLDVLPFPTDERELGPQVLTLLDFIPVSGRLQESEAALREYYGIAVYRMLLPLRHTGTRHN
jgi:uncharacterized SAM-binding protein YcdF (DUF218 family)